MFLLGGIALQQVPRSPNPAQFSIPGRGICVSVPIQGCQRTQTQGCSSSSTFCLPVWGELTQFWHPAFSRELPRPNSLSSEPPNLLGKGLDEQTGSSKGSKNSKFGKSPRDSPWNMIFVLSRGATAVLATAPASAPDIREFSTFFFSWLSWGKKNKSIPQGIIFHFFCSIHPRARIWNKMFH